MTVPVSPPEGTWRPKVAFAMRNDELRSRLFPGSLRERLAGAAEVIHEGVLTEFSSPQSQRVLADCEVLVTGWGCPPVDGSVLDLAPKLRLIAHSAGTVKYHIGRETWDRGISVTTAAQANARPVAEYTLAFILLAGKKAFAAAHQLALHQGSFDKSGLNPDMGNYGTTVGIIGASRVGRLVLELLRPFNFEVLLTTPELSAEQAAELGARLVPLDELLAQSAIVSLHAPILPETIGMIGREQLALMPDDATFINTARGVLVDHAALRDELMAGRLSAVLDVTDPEPLPTGDILYSLPNVVLTPHIAGALGNELVMMGDAVVAEIESLAAGRPYRFPVTSRDLVMMA
jgi:phosphoglycerate dehydrogenase-like enzyme